MANQIVWVDIPVLDLDRAIQFYSAVLGGKIQRFEMSGMAFGLLPDADKSVSGCLVKGESHQPSSSGPMIYLNAQGRLDEALTAVESHGGKILTAKHSIAPHGFRGIVLDSEGNRIALHSV